MIPKQINIAGTITKDKNGFDIVEGDIVLSTIGVEAGHIAKVDDIVVEFDKLLGAYDDDIVLIQILFSFPLFENSTSHNYFFNSK